MRKTCAVKYSGNAAASLCKTIFTKSLKFASCLQLVHADADISVDCFCYRRQQRHRFGDWAACRSDNRSISQSNVIITLFYNAKVIVNVRCESTIRKISFVAHIRGKNKVKLNCTVIMALRLFTFTVKRACLYLSNNIKRSHVYIVGCSSLVNIHRNSTFTLKSQLIL